MTTKNSTAYSRLQGKKFFRLSLFACVLTAGLFTACSSDDDGNAIEAEPQAPRLITVEVSETPLAEEGAEARQEEILLILPHFRVLQCTVYIMV